MTTAQQFARIRRAIAFFCLTEEAQAEKLSQSRPMSSEALKAKYAGLKAKVTSKP
jgi:hypothetical protein